MRRWHSLSSLVIAMVLIVGLAGVFGASLMVSFFTPRALAPLFNDLLENRLAEIREDLRPLVNIGDWFSLGRRASAINAAGHKLGEVFFLPPGGWGPARMAKSTQPAWISGDR